MDWLWQLDKKIFYYIHVSLNNGSWGDFWLYIGGLFNNWSSGYFHNVVLWLLAFRKGMRDYVVMIALTPVLANFLYRFIERLADRMRPGMFAFSTPLRDVVKNSFPSGHTGGSIAICVMTLLIIRNTRYTWLRWIIYPYAILVALSQVLVGSHFLTDVIGGICFGSVFASVWYLVCAKYGWLPQKAES
jgi:undecaprenyl-diphosphatase